MVQKKDPSLKSKQQNEKELKDPSKPQVDDWRTRINWEKIYKIISIIVLALIPFFIRDMIIFRKAMVENNFTIFPWTYMLKVALATLIFAIIRKIYFLSTNSYIMSKIPAQYKKNEERALHTKKIQKWTFDFIYYSLTTIYGFICFRHTNWYPVNISYKQEDNTLDLHTQWPNQPVDQDYYKYMEFILVVQFGHHTWGVLDLIFSRRKSENRFYEWFLHHILAWTLIFYSSYFNITIVGISVLIIHDIGDIFIVMFKTYAEFSSKGFVFKYLVFQMISGWFLTRVYLYPKVLIYPVIVYKRIMTGQPLFELANACYTYQTIMLSVLYFMHIYWFASMITLLISYIKKEGKEKKSISNKAKKEQKEGYGNPWDYVHYSKKEQQQQQQQNIEEKKQI